MARPRKTCLDYFPMDTVLDEKFQALEELHGNDGFVWMVKFWQKAYRTKNGIVDLDGVFGVIDRKTSRLSPEKHREIIGNALKLKLIYKTEDGKYTSDGIQKRISKVKKEREKDRIRSKNELSDGKPPENLGVSEVFGNYPAERKGNKTKLKERKEKELSEKFSDDTHPLRLAKFFDKKISEYCESYKRRTQAQLQKWAKTIDVMIRIDKRTPEQVEAIITAIAADSGNENFAWRDNIKCPDKLRKQWNGGKLDRFAGKKHAMTEAELEIVKKCTTWTEQEFFDSFGYARPYDHFEACEILGWEPWKKKGDC